MFTVPALATVLFFILMRPQEWFASLQHFPFLYFFVALAVLGYGVDLRLQRSRAATGPQLLIVVAFWIWALVTVALKASGQAMTAATHLLLVIVVFIASSQGVQTFRGLRVLAGAFTLCGMLLATIAIHQRHQPKQCVMLDETLPTSNSSTPDGRRCERPIDCVVQPGAQPNSDYECEHVGLLGTTTFRGRVRYRGILQDPNELSIALCVTAVLLFLSTGGMRWPWMILARLLTLGPVIIAIIYTQSRGGLLAFATAIMCYFAMHFGWRGIVLAVATSAPIALLGGRDGAEATSSSLGRLEAWRAGLHMLRENPLLGVGAGQFTEHHHLTAHSAYVLAFAELGLGGFFLWFALAYVSLKISVTALRRYRGRPDGALARQWALALLAAQLSVLVGSLFLSLTYHFLPWIVMSFSGAFYLAVRRHDTGFAVRFDLRDAVGVALGCAVYVALLEGVLRLNFV